MEDEGADEEGDEKDDPEAEADSVSQSLNFKSLISLEYRFPETLRLGPRRKQMQWNMKRLMKRPKLAV